MINLLTIKYFQAYCLTQKKFCDKNIDKLLDIHHNQLLSKAEK